MTLRRLPTHCLNIALACVLRLAALSASAAPVDETLQALRQAAERGDAQAQWAWGVLLTDRGKSEYDRAAGRKWKQLAADQGHAIALAALGVEAADAGDKPAALAWFRRAAGSGDAELQHGLATMLANGELGEKDATEAVHWWRAAALQGHAEAQTALATAYGLGEGVDQIGGAALFWALLAKASGHARAAGLARNLGTAFDADVGQRIRADAAAWHPGRPAMPYAQGRLVYTPPPHSIGSPLPLRVPAALADALAWDGKEGESTLRVLLSRFELDSKAGVPTAPRPNLVLDFAADGSLARALIQHNEGVIEVDPKHVRASIEADDDAVHGEVRMLDGLAPETTGHWIEARFHVPKVKAN